MDPIQQYREEVKEWRRQCRELEAKFQQVEHDRDEARANARVLAHAYETDNRPPARVVKESLAYPMIAQSITDRRRKQDEEAVEDDHRDLE